MKVGSFWYAPFRQELLTLRHDIGRIVIGRALLQPSLKLLVLVGATSLFILVIKKALLAYFGYETTRLDLHEQVFILSLHWDQVLTGDHRHNVLLCLKLLLDGSLVSHPQYKLLVLSLMLVRVKSAFKSLHNVQNLFLNSIINLMWLTSSRCIHLCSMPVHNCKLFVQLKDVFCSFDIDFWLSLSATDCTVLTCENSRRFLVLVTRIAERTHLLNSDVECFGRHSLRLILDDLRKF